MRIESMERGRVPKALEDVDEPISLLYYGEGGTGKTTDLFHAALLGKLWVANAETGIKARAVKQWGIELDNFELFPGDDEKIEFDTVLGEWKRIREELHGDPGAYFATGWDSVSEIQALMKDEEMAARHMKKLRQGQEVSRFVMDEDNWRTVNEECRQLIRKFRYELPCHFIMTALERRDVDKQSGRVTIQPAVTPGLQKDLVGWVDIVCHCRTIQLGDEEVYMGLMRNSGIYRGKDRYKLLPRQLVNPTFDRILKYYQGELTLETDDEMNSLRERMEAAKKDEQEPAAIAA